jgi:hypothetical protein
MIYTATRHTEKRNKVFPKIKQDHYQAETIGYDPDRSPDGLCGDIGVFSDSDR